MTMSDTIGVPRLAIPTFGHTECTHGTLNDGTLLTTLFPQALSVARSYSRSLLNQIGRAISDEVRAKHNTATSGTYPNGVICWVFKMSCCLIVGWLVFCVCISTDRLLLILSIYHHTDRQLLQQAPVVNVCRDPRWGRCQEGYGEDPYLQGELSAAYVRSLQNTFQTSATTYYQAGNNESCVWYAKFEPSSRITLTLPSLGATCKHFDVHSGMKHPQFVLGLRDHNTLSEFLCNW